MKGKKAQYRYAIKFKSDTARINELFYNKKKDAQHDLNLMRKSPNYHNMRLRKL